MTDKAKEEQIMIDKYDELSVIYNTIDKLLEQIHDKDIIDSFKTDLMQIMFDAKDLMDEIDDELYVEADDDVFELIQEENYYDDIWRKENGYE